MFNLLVSGAPWQPNRDTISTSRVLSYTAKDLLEDFAPGGTVRYDLLRDLPALFVHETQFHQSEQQPARVGRILSAEVRGGDVHIEYLLDTNVPPIPHQRIIEMASALDIDLTGRGYTELEHTHWAVKRSDLFKQLFYCMRSPTRSPTVFQLPEPQLIDVQQVSAMMPFAPAFNGVYEAISGAAADNGMGCNRADDVWDHHAIIQDIVSLIDRSAVLVCDCSGKNANVFYEIGIAHALGKEVILITQHADDVPFDLRHLRYISYLNNGEGCQRLRVELARRIAALIAR